MGMKNMTTHFDINDMDKPTKFYSITFFKNQ